MNLFKRSALFSYKRSINDSVDWNIARKASKPRAINETKARYGKC